MATTLSQQKALAIAPKFTAFASLVCSSLIAVLIIGQRHNRSDTPKVSYHRLLLGMAFTDMSASAAWFFTTWPIPRGTPGVYGAVGNQQTCSAQAFFAQFSLSTVMYNASLAVYFVLVIVKGWDEKQVGRIEKYLHLNAIAWGLGTSLASLGLTLFNQVGWDCWISAAPLGCKESWQLEPGEATTCTRGDNGSLYQWAFYYAPLWVVIILVSGLMYWVYASVRAKERAMYQYGITHSRDSASLNRRRARVAYHARIRMQAFCYVGAFFVAWFFPTVFQLVIVISKEIPYPLLFLTAFFVPCQGFLNLIVFLRPKYLKYRHDNPRRCAIITWLCMLGEELLLVRKAVTTSPSTTCPREVVESEAEKIEMCEGEEWSDNKSGTTIP